MDKVIYRVARYYGISNLLRKTRVERWVDARHVCVYILRTHYGFTLQTIQKRFGFKHHSSVIWSCDKVAAVIGYNKEWLYDVNELLFSCIHDVEPIAKPLKPKKRTSYYVKVKPKF